MMKREVVFLQGMTCIDRVWNYDKKKKTSLEFGLPFVVIPLDGFIIHGSFVLQLVVYLWKNVEGNLLWMYDSKLGPIR